MKNLKKIFTILFIIILSLSMLGCVKITNFKNEEIIVEEDVYFQVYDYLTYYDTDGNTWFATATVTDCDGVEVDLVNYIFKVEKDYYKVKITINNGKRVIKKRTLTVKKA